MEDDEAPLESQPSRYLLPPGCKDLIDVLRQARSSPAASAKPDENLPEFFWLGEATKPAGSPWNAHVCQEQLAKLLPPAGTTPSVVYLPDSITVRELALHLNQKPFVLVAVLMVLGRFVSIQEHLTFAEAASLCAQFGTIAQRTS